MSRNYWTLGKKGIESRLTKAQAAYENALENVSDLHVKISEGNSKLGAIPSVSLIPVMDCGNCAICAKSCYDLRNDMIYKGSSRREPSTLQSTMRIPNDTSRRLTGISTTATLEHSDSTSVVTSRTNGILTKCARLLASIRTPSSWHSQRCSMYVTSTSMRETSFPRTCTSYSADGLASRWTTVTVFLKRILSSRAAHQHRKERCYVPETVQSA